MLVEGQGENANGVGGVGGVGTVLALSVAAARTEQLTELAGLGVRLHCAPHVDPGQQVVLTGRAG